tara:strand:+ start:150 stop:317 length:168 start_codon:yes stop_codon:yes gene_type:complete
MEKFNGVRKIGNIYRAMIYRDGKHIHLIDTKSEEDAEDAIDIALMEFRKKDKLNK